MVNSISWVANNIFIFFENCFFFLGYINEVTDSRPKLIYKQQLEWFIIQGFWEFLIALIFFFLSFIIINILTSTLSMRRCQLFIYQRYVNKNRIVLKYWFFYENKMNIIFTLVVFGAYTIVLFAMLAGGNLRWKTIQFLIININ